MRDPSLVDAVGYGNDVTATVPKPSPPGEAGPPLAAEVRASAGRRSSRKLRHLGQDGFGTDACLLTSCVIVKVQDQPDNVRDAIRDKSKALLGNRYRLELGLAVAGTPKLFAHALARELGLPDRTVGEELRRLEAGGLLRRMPDRAPGQARIYYERLPSCHWENLEQLATELVERQSAPRAPPRRLRPA
jgi:hypothetical protein